MSEYALAFKAWNLLNNGFGSIDWAGLPLVVEMLGVDDVATLIHRFLIIKLHKPDEGT